MSHKVWAAVAAGLVLLGGVSVALVQRPAAPPAQQATLPASAAADRGEGSVPGGPASRQDEPAATTAAQRPAPSHTRSPPVSSSPTVAARQAERQRADAIRRQLSERRARVTTAVRGVEPPAAPEPESVTEALSEAERTRRREYMQRALNDEYVPVATSCYSELLERQPSAQGKVLLEFTIVGDADTGGVVETAELRDDSTMDDPEFVQCMRESLYSTVFEPPPPGASRTTVVYPLELHP